MKAVFQFFLLFFFCFQIAFPLTCSPENLDVCDERQSAAIQKYLSLSKGDLDLAIQEIERKITEANDELLAEKNQLTKIIDEAKERHEEKQHAIISDNLVGEIKLFREIREEEERRDEEEEDFEDREMLEEINEIEEEQENLHSDPEVDRVKEYEARNYTWPPKIFPDTPGWNDLMMRRFRQLEFVEDTEDRWFGLLNHVICAFVAPNFTESGWGLTRAPQGLVDELRQALKDGLASNPPMEDELGELIEGGERPLLIEAHELVDKTLIELKPFHEAWSGIPLIEQNAYGLRVYRNNSDLKMHVDISRTHIVSCILHIDHDDDPESEPWPIVIEDFQGNTNEVILESGDMLFYESSKCMHGRPKKFKGKWYSSIFVHYYPANDWNLDERDEEARVAVPPGWDRAPPEEEMGVEPLQVVERASFKETTCENNWCALKNSVKWRGPAKFGEVLTAGGVTFPLFKDEVEV